MRHALPIALALPLTGLVLGLGASCARPSSAFLGATDLSPCDDQLRGPVRIASFNIKSAELSSVDRIAGVLEGLTPDIVALEEVDVGTKRAGGVDQPAALAERLGMRSLFAGAVERDGGQYGVALLTRLPLVEAKRVPLPDVVGSFERRVAIDAKVCAGGVPLRVVATHADVMPWSAPRHAQALLDEVRDERGPVVVLGDLNQTPDAPSVRAFSEAGFHDVIGALADGPTFLDRRLDYVLSHHLDALEAEIVDTDASDHRPVAAELQEPDAE